MTISDLREVCLAFPGVTEDIKWGEYLCFNISGKMFMITSPDDVPVAASFKTSPKDFDALCDREGFIPAPYLARYTWIHIDDISRLTPKQWKQYSQQAYELVVARLPLKIRLQLNEPDKATRSSKVGKNKIKRGKKMN